MWGPLQIMPSTPNSFLTFALSFTYASRRSLQRWQRWAVSAGFWEEKKKRKTTNPICHSDFLPTLLIRIANRSQRKECVEDRSEDSCLLSPGGYGLEMVQAEKSFGRFRANMWWRSEALRNNGLDGLEKRTRMRMGVGAALAIRKRRIKGSRNTRGFLWRTQS